MTSALTEEERKALALRGYVDPKFFCKFYLGHWFPKPMPWPHLGVLAILTRRCDFLLKFDEHYGIEELKKIVRHFTWREDPENQDSPEHSVFSFDQNPDGSLSISMTLGKNTLIMMPRGTSKTTLANAATIWYIEYQDCKFPVYLSETQTHASQQMSNVTRELTTNARLLSVFGDPRPDQRSGFKWSESEGFVQTTTGISIAAKGRGSQVRGLNVGGQRPDRLLFDDVEDKEAVKTEEQRTKTREWFFGDVLPALPKLDDKASATALGTLLSNESVLMLLKRDPEWTTIHLGALDKDMEPIWKEWMDDEKLEREKQSYASKGLLDTFYLEYFNSIRAGDKAKFKDEYFIVEPVPMELVPWRAIAIDPAISKKKKACPTVIAVVGMRKDGIIQILDLWGKVGATPREQVDMYFALKMRWDTCEQGVESIAYQAALIHILQEEMFRQGKIHGVKAYFEITPQTHGMKKEERVEGVLQPRFAAKYVRLQRQFAQLTTQLLDWPNGGFDWADATAMAVALLDKYAGLAGGSDDAGKDTMPPLDEVMGGDWRQH